MRAASMALVVLACSCAPRPPPERSFDHQACVEHALGGQPDIAALPAAQEHFEAKCRGGDAGACSTLGLIHERGLVAAPDPVKAMELYDGACRAGNMGGCRNLALMLLGANGGAIIDEPRGAELLSRACRGGSARACTELGHLHLIGRSVPRDDVAAARAYEGACLLREADACYNLGTMYEAGRPQPDRERARQMYQQACLFGLDRGCTALDRLRESLQSPVSGLQLKAGD